MTELFTEEELRIIEEAKKTYPEYSGKNPQKNFQDLTGKIFGQLKVLYRGESHLKCKPVWICLCGCGNIKPFAGDSLKYKHVESCGCLGRPSCRTYNIYDLETYDFGVGWTKNGQPFYFDKEDYDKIKDYKWYKSVRGDIVSGTNKIKMHRLIMDVLDCPDVVVDHIYHNLDGSGREYDNRKCNLRITNKKGNAKNTREGINTVTGVWGTGYDSRSNKYYATIRADGVKHWLGSFATLEEAARARKEAEERYFGEFQYKTCDIEVPPLNLNKEAV